MNQIVASAVTEKISALHTTSSLNVRAVRGDRRKFERVLSKIPDVRPPGFDRIPALNNKWRWGSVHFKMPELPAELLALSGIVPVTLVVDRNTGREVVLLIVNPMEGMAEFKDRNKTRLVVMSGLAATSFGPIGWFLFRFPDPETENEFVFERVVNPKDPGQLLIYESLAAQKYWHVILTDENGQVVNFFEFENNYGLSDAVRRMEIASSDMLVGDFEAAKSEYGIAYSIDHLLALDTGDASIPIAPHHGSPGSRRWTMAL